MQEFHLKSAEQHTLAYQRHRSAVENALRGDHAAAKQDALRSRQHSLQAHTILNEALTQLSKTGVREK